MSLDNNERNTVVAERFEFLMRWGAIKSQLLEAHWRKEETQTAHSEFCDIKNILGDCGEVGYFSGGAFRKEVT